jgi:hypothetical protein
VTHIRNIATVFLFAAFPILFVFLRNQAFIHEGGLMLPVLMCIIVCIGLYVGLNKLKQQPTNNTLIVILILFWFLLYGHVYYFILDTFSVDYLVFRHRYYFPLYSLLFIVPLWKLWQAASISPKVSQVLLVIAISLNVQFIIPFVNYISANTTAKIQTRPVVFTSEFPDVYYIITDSYPSAINLKKYYDFDNSGFVNELKALGFQVQDSAKSNYPYTYFSLASSLNMDYINYFEDSVSIEKHNEDYPFTTIYNNKTASYFKQKGYQYVQFQSAYEQLNNESSADIYIKSETSFNQFHQALMEQNLLSCLNIQFYNKKIFEVCTEAFAKLPETPNIKGSKFVFFHALPPHPPYVFDEKGNYVASAAKVENRFREKQAYINQVNYVNKMLLKSIKKIIETSAMPPIIILQGDHGSSTAEMYEDETKWQHNPSRELLNERYGILQAIYIPATYSVTIPADNTPVNTFRRVCNTLFGDSLTILPNKHFFANYRKPYDFREINWQAVNDTTATTWLDLEQ